ncbi:MAG: metallophosphoesterase [Bacteroidales bacterium]|jgi:predicted MPP superfamily phosphohydrolase|nr:metallophosphoesterase [Bacteroidales bacterium]
MRKIKIILSGLLIFLIPSVFTLCGSNKPSEEPEIPVQPEESDGCPRFIVISDTHFGNSAGRGPMEKVPRALKNLTGKTPEADAVFVVGDITEGGESRQYDQLLSVFGDRANVPEGMPVYFMMGNHDNFSGANAASLYLSKTEQPLNQYIIIKGYPFITVSETGSDQNDFNAAAVKFLADNLAKAAKDYPGKPVFVFIHVPTINTTYGSVVSGALPDGGWCTDRFKSTLDKYPQTVVFSGHTHYPLGDPRSIHQDRFTAINTASTTYSEVEPNIELSGGTLPNGCENITEGLIVTVKENGDVELERWDTHRNEEIAPRWLLQAPHDGTAFAYKNRTGGTAPAFAGNAQPTVGNIAFGACSVSFPQASDDELVHHYKVEILNGNTVAAKHVIFSGFYLNSDMPATLTVDFTGLSASTSYTARVTAYDSYRRPSQPIRAVFRTAE